MLMAAYLKGIPVMELHSVDLCFMLNSIVEMKKQIDDLSGIKMLVSEL